MLTYMFNCFTSFQSLSDSHSSGFYSRQNFPVLGFQVRGWKVFFPTLQRPFQPELLWCILHHVEPLETDTYLIMCCMSHVA